MDFADWLALFRRYWRSLVAATVIGALVGMAATLLQERTWTSSAELLLTPSAEASDGQDLAYAGQYVSTRMKTYRRLAASARVRDAAVAALPDGNGAVGAIDASWEPETTVLTIEVTSTSAEDAQEDAGIVVAEFAKALAEVERGSQRVAAVTADVIGEPTLPASRTSPTPVTNVLAGAVLGFLAGLALALFRRLREPSGPRAP